MRGRGRPGLLLFALVRYWCKRVSHPQSASLCVDAKATWPPAAAARAPQVFREIEIHSRLHHRHIVQLYGVFRQEQYVVLVQEYARGGDLHRILANRLLGGRLPERQAIDTVLYPLVQVGAGGLLGLLLAACLRQLQVCCSIGDVGCVQLPRASSLSPAPASPLRCTSCGLDLPACRECT